MGPSCRSLVFGSNLPTYRPNLRTGTRESLAVNQLVVMKRSLLSGTAWNLLGLVVPLFVAVLAIPWLMTLLGLERFGFLALVWAVVGYASVLDLGIGKTLIRLVSRQLADGDRVGAMNLATTAVQLLVSIGLALGLLLLPVAELAFSHAEATLSLPRDEARGALWLVAALMPQVLLNTAQVSVVSAWQDFKVLNLLRAVLSTFTYLAPLGLALLGVSDLRWIVGSLFLVRLASVIAFGVVCWRRYRWFPRPGRWSRPMLASLLSVGRWMFIANLAGPLMTYLDRFIVGLQLPLRDVAIYAAPSEIPNRLLMVPYALLATLFPRVAALDRDRAALQQVLGQSVRWLCGLVTPIVLIGVAFAVPGMSAWLGAVNGPQAAMVLQVLLAGLWLTSISMGPITVVQAAGDLRHLALFYLAQLPMLLGLLWVMTDHLGIFGAALAVATRQLIDTAGMLWLAVRQVGRPPGRWAHFALGLLGSAGLLTLAAGARTWLEGFGVAGIGLAAWAAIAWWLWIDVDERKLIRGWTKSLSRQSGSPPAAG